MSNPIQYTSNDYQSVMNDINADAELKDKPEWWKRIWAGVRDVANMMENAIANQSFLRTAFTRQAVADLCALIDYQLTPYTTSSGYLIFHLNANTMTFPQTFTIAELKAMSQGTLSVSSLQFESRLGATVTAITESYTADSTTDKLTVARVYTTGEKVRLTTTGTIPTPLAIDTDYYVIYFDNTHIRLATTIVKAYQNDYIDITANGSATNTIHLYSFQAFCYQQESLASAISLGVSDGSTAWQTFALPDKYVLDDTLVITINSVPWTKVTSFVNSVTTDTHYKLIHLNNGDTEIMFGNGTYGSIPGAFDVYALYSKGGGAITNVGSQNRINAYAGSNNMIMGVTNSVLFTGGADEQSMEDAKILGPTLLKARSRDITVEDGQYLASAYTGVLKAKVNKNVYGVLSQQVVIVPNGGGYPSSGLKSTLASYLIDLTILESVDTRVIDPTYITVDVTGTVKILSGYTWATVQSYVVLALRMLFSEVTDEIIAAYNASGISSAVSYINSKWSTSFTDTDYAAITRLITNITSTDFGVDFQDSDVIGFVDAFVLGVDYIVISSPSFPITVDDDEITTSGTMTITQIT